MRQNERLTKCDAISSLLPPVGRDDDRAIDHDGNAMNGSLELSYHRLRQAVQRGGGCDQFPTGTQPPARHPVFK
jgi:hypothetical protein